MYNKYINSDFDAFSDMYTQVEETKAEMRNEAPKKSAGGIGFDLKKLLGNFGMVPLLLLILLIADAEDDERLIIIALAVILGL